MDIKDKVIIVTGASQGIGLATAHLLAKHGAQVVLAARSIDALNKIAKEIPKAIAIQTDMRSPEAIKNLIHTTIEKHGRIDVLINNAGQGMYSSVETTNRADYKNMMELNIYGVLEAMQRVIPQMREAGGIKTIQEACEKLKEKHEGHIAVYGAGNEERLTGKHETCSIHEFRYSISDRGASIRIPMATANNKCGYLEDRRPAANMDPYQVCAKLIETTCLQT